MQVVIIGPNLMTEDGASFHVHRSTCGDAITRQYRGCSKYVEDHDSFDSIVESMFSDQLREDPTYGIESYKGEFKLFPCVPKSIIS